ncbi:MAG TPA: peptidoglycan DD-metalloendopeptidase family protein [Thermoanaerobaculia bacterium]|nr:peptidoglycan DD-metalloendopeptidase family protein [Thermoanaerobaculia bacterium]
MFRWRRIAVLLALSAAGALSHGAQPPASPVALGEGRLAAIQGEIRGLEAQLASLGQAAESIEGEIARLGLEVRLQERRVAEAGVAVGLAEARAQEAERRLGELEARLLATRETLRRNLRSLYRLGRYGYLRLLLSAQAGSDPLAAVRLARYLARRDDAEIDRYETLRSGVLAERDRLRRERDERAAWRKREEERRAALSELRGEQSRLLARAERERLSLASRAVELAAEAARLTQLFSDLSGEVAPLAGTPMQSFRGTLEKPAAGEVAIGFGPRPDPRYGTRVPHNGIEIATRPGSEVRVVYPGKVLFAAPFRGLGPTVIVLHPGKMFSLYAGLEGVRVGKGDMVPIGQTLGAATDRLYFEIRLDNRPVDPLGWLR